MSADQRFQIPTEFCTTRTTFLYGGYVRRRLFFRHIMSVRAIIACLLALPLVTWADPNSAKDKAYETLPAKIDFSRDILPVISSKCFHCHGPDESHRAAKLRLARKAFVPQQRASKPVASSPSCSRRRGHEAPGTGLPLNAASIPAAMRGCAWSRGN